MITTFLGVRGPEAAAFQDRAGSLGAHVVVSEPDLVVLAAPGAVASHVDEDIACVVFGWPDLEHLPSSVARDAATRIAEVYRKHGERVLSLLRPPFALLLWRRSPGTGLIATDQLGSRSVFTAQLHGELAFSGEIVDLLEVLPTRPAPDLAALGSWLAGRGISTDRTLYAGIDRLPGGHLIPLAREAKGAARRYAPEPRAEIVEASPEAVALRVRAAVQRAVEVRLPVDATSGVLLSGGIDSTSVAAAVVRARGSDQTVAISAVFPDRPEVDESALISAVTERLSMRAERVAVSVRPVLGDTLDFQARWHVPPVSPTIGFQLTLQRFALRVGATIVLDGEGGDELFGLRPYLIADALRRGQAIRAWRLARGFTDDARTARRALALFGLKGAVPARMHRLRAARRPAWLRDDVDFELPADTTSSAWKSLQGPRWSAEARDQLTVGRERMGAHDHLRRRSVMAGSFAAHPFLQDLDLIELALQLPPEQGFSAAYDRPALRDAMRGELPEAVRLRTEKSYFNHLFEDALNGPDRRALEVLLAPGAEISALVRPEFLRQLLAFPEEGRRGVWSWTAWRFAAAESWLRLQSDPSGV